MIILPEPPRLAEPTPAVRTSYLTGEQADMRARGSDTAWLGPASEDFEQFVAARSGTQERWGVPCSIWWYVSGQHYLGTLVLRHELTEDEGGGHIGYHVVQPWQHHGHATRMLGLGLARSRQLGITAVLLTVAPDNEWSHRIVKHHGGQQDGINHEGEVRYWIAQGGRLHDLGA
ncbi:GNAT family N-acetyltransferase [Aeromicrobium sp. CF4.19]|uniref:GNAT family N-acetyltransferase n=1 Tax=Aeromicrobium sp. CF4.19 TaxID=3373082 RepID=UPI003EE51AA6